MKSTIYSLTLLTAARISGNIQANSAL